MKECLRGYVVIKRLVTALDLLETTNQPHYSDLFSFFEVTLLHSLSERKLERQGERKDMRT